jgi:ethanolamine permease
VTHGSRKTPHLALFTGSALGLAIIMAVWFALGAEKGGATIGATLLNMAVFGAMISYAFQGISFIQLRRMMPNIERPYRSPLGVPGAAATVVIAVVTLWYQFQDPVYRNGVYAALAWYLLGVLYFAFVGRHRLVLSPEEEFAITGGQHGHPEREGYGTTKV